MPRPDKYNPIKYPELPRFKGIVHCPKCGANTIDLQRHWIEFIERPDIMRTKCHCHYIWDEKCLDAPE